MRRIPPLLTPGHPGALAREIAENPEPGSDREFGLAMLERLSGLTDAIRQTFTDKLWQSIPSYVQEYGRNDSWATAAPVVVNAAIGELVRIELVVVSIPTGSTGTLALGDHVFTNLGAGVTNLRVSRLLNAGDTRTLTLTSGAGGAAQVALYGHQLAPTGTMAP